MALRIVTDSTADLPSEIRKEYGIEMVPLTVHFGPESFLDVVEMDQEAFWAKLKTSSHHPKTAQPSPGDFLQVYERLHKAGDEILSIHISSNLSGTLNSAQIAAKMLPDAKITTVDTKSVSLGIGMMVIQAARMAKAGKPAAEIVNWIGEVASRAYIIFTLDTLEFLHKNGRVGKAQAFLGGLLGVKPILEIDRDGFVAPADKVRGKSKVRPRALELMQERIPAGRKIWMSILHAQVPEEAAAWVEEVKKIYQVEEYWIASIGPVIATNGGPGTLGVAFFEV
ncbi:MAG TPA: DegV family protein [Symbiobacteriaceae bacterium]|jgi:DegV family protein with EDD domain